MAWLALSISASIAAPLVQANPKPDTVPAMPDAAWQRSSGSGTLSITCTNTVWYAGGPQTQTTAQLLAKEIAALPTLNCTYALAIGTNPGSMQPGDVFLDATCGSIPNFNSNHHAEAYGIDIYSGGQFWVDSDSDAGLFWGTRTLLQLLTSTGNAVPDGGHGAYDGDNGLDYPLYEHRGVFLDIGRRFVNDSVADTKAAIYQYIRAASYAKMNELWLHLGETTTHYPGLRLCGAVLPSNGVNVSSPLCFTQSDINDIISYAGQHQMAVYPSIPAPGHCGWYLNAKGSSYGVSGSDTSSDCDITNQTVRADLIWVYQHFASWFSANTVMGGGDEWLWAYDPRLHSFGFDSPDYPSGCTESGCNTLCDGSQSYDKTDMIVAWMNTLNSALGSLNPSKYVWTYADVVQFKGSRWNNGASLAANPYGTGKCKLSTDILLVPWVGWVSANELLEAGFNLVSAGSTVFTYQLGGWYPDIDADAPNQLYSNGIRNLWSSDPSIQTTPKNSFFADFTNSCDYVQGIGLAPGCDIDTYANNRYYGGTFDYNYTPYGRQFAWEDAGSYGANRIKGAQFQVWADDPWGDVGDHYWNSRAGHPDGLGARNQLYMTGEIMWGRGHASTPGSLDDEYFLCNNIGEPPLDSKVTNTGN